MEIVTEASTSTILILASGSTESGDPSTNLSRPAKRDAQRIGSWMRENERVPERVFCLSGGAALATAEKAVKAAGLGGDRIERVEETGGVGIWSRVRGEIEGDERVLLVGNLAQVTRLLAELRPGDCGERALRDGVLVHFCPGSEATPEWVDPAELPRDFPYPAEERGGKRRPRPAYYYRQSGVLPYRVRSNGVVEVLLITSSSGKKWGIPKGIHEPGMSATGSAMIEAFEEAGILGEIVGERVGSYRARKWGASCEVTVFAMRVLRELDPPVWTESRRIREWMPVPLAADRITVPELGDLLLRLPETLS